MKIFITGGTGFIGNALALRLAQRGDDVTCLVRNMSHFATNGEKINLVQGDIRDNGLAGLIPENTEVVFHVAAFAKSWSEDPGLPRAVNVEGTRNMLKASEKAGVRLFIHTSTAAVFGFSMGDNMITEDCEIITKSGIEYSDTKGEAEKMVLEYNCPAMSCVVVNPTRVYGPGPVNESNSVTRLIRDYLTGRWRFIPGNGNSIGNYVYIDDVIDGHILAITKGKSGENYILGGEDLSFNELFRNLGQLTKLDRRMIRIPAPLLSGIAATMEFYANLTSTKPLITRKWANRYLRDMRVSSAKAVRDLGYSPRPFSQGALETLRWLEQK